VDKNREGLFSIGEFAEKAGVTLRTLRYYDKIGLLKPSAHNDAGHRLYSKQDFARLQKILTLKFVGFSLEDIKNVVKYDINDEDFRKSLEIQKRIMEQKIQHTFMVMNAIDEALEMDNYDDSGNWDKFINIINVINSDEKLVEQYENASNLRARINIHEAYSTNKYGWMEWFFDQLKIPQSAKILEIGCGDASLWVKNIDKVPEGWDITITDFSEGMLSDAKRNLGSRANRFKFEIVDVENIPFHDCTFDVVIANHMLYHVENKEKAFSEISRVLKDDGYFYAATVGKKHMAEMRSIIYKFKANVMNTNSWNLTSTFQLENGLRQIQKWFSNVNVKKYEDNLIVTKAEPIIDYIFSLPGNVRVKFDEKKLKELTEYLKNRIVKEDGIFITKNTGFFEGRKEKLLDKR
jgi:DNA-binding transcriptional MerR regulator